MSSIKLLVFTIGLGSGIIVPTMPNLWLLGTVTILAVVFCFHKIAIYPSLFLLGLCLSLVRLQAQIDQQLPSALEGKDLRITLKITDLPEQFERSTRIVGQILEMENGNWTGTVRLSWYHAPQLQPGQVWQLVTRLRRPRGLSNPNGFDYHAWLLSQQIFATGYVKKSPQNNWLADDIKFSIAAMRFHLVDTLFANAEKLAHPQLLRALILGDRSNMTRRDWDVLQATGTIHLMAISGLHIGLIAAIGFLAGMFLMRAITLIVGTRPLLRLIAPLASIGLALVYALLAGFTIPTQRALVFTIAVNLAWLGFRRVDVYYLVALCALVVVLLDPFAFLAQGFWLSFAAVLLLIFLFAHRSARPTKLQAAVTGQLGLFVGMLIPLILLHLPVSVLSPFANLVAVPVVSLAVIPLLFAAVVAGIVSPCLTDLFLQGADFILHWLWLFLQKVGNPDLLVQFPSHTFPLAVVLGILALAMVLAPRGLPIKMFGLALLVLFLFPKSEQHDFQLTVLDVGQGLSVVVQTQNTTLLYDAGAYYSENFDVGANIVAPYLLSQGISELQGFFISHEDNDHAGGAAGILAKMPANLVLSASSQPALSELRQSAKTLQDCYRGKKWQFDELKVEAMWPLDPRVPRPGWGDSVNRTKTNNRSCTLLVTFGDISVLLPGDIESDVESALLKSGQLPDQVDILIAPHHGSNSSSTESFIDQIAPRFVVFSAGYKNRYRHPHPKVVKRYQNHGSSRYNTAHQGAVTFSLERDGQLRVQTHRNSRQRLWHSESAYFGNSLN